jgi:hypothetical protein
VSLAELEIFRQRETHFLCDALIAATFSFFSAIRFAMRVLRNTKHELQEEEGRVETHSYSVFCSF